MKFIIGSDTDSAHCVALKHEFLCCEAAFKEFAQCGTAMIARSQAQETANAPVIANENRWVAFKTYNAYTRFVHHLYEFLLGAMARERGSTGENGWKDSDPWIQENAQRVLTGRRSAILNGTAPAWENHISAFPETVPPEFSKEFRAIRNKGHGHVTHERPSKSLTDFYEKYHKFIYMTYYHCLGHWGSFRDEEFPDLKEITRFSVLIKRANESTP